VLRGHLRPYLRARSEPRPRLDAFGFTTGSTPRGHSTAPDRRSCSRLGPTLAAVDVNEDQMATRWTFRRSSLTAPGPELLFRLNGSVVFTRDYVKHRLLSKKPYGQGPRASLRRFILDLSVKSRTWTSAYRRANSYVKCPSITSGPSVASMLQAASLLQCCSCQRRLCGFRGRLSSAMPVLQCRCTRLATLRAIRTLILEIGIREDKWH
jgi:hypothetical protein